VWRRSLLLTGQRSLSNLKPQKLVERVQPGDVLVTRPDRLARPTRDLLNVLDAVKQAGAGFRSLKDTWADTTTPHVQLMLAILGELAEFESTLIRARTGEGRERAKARGVRFGGRRSSRRTNATRPSTFAALHDGHGNMGLHITTRRSRAPEVRSGGNPGAGHKTIMGAEVFRVHSAGSRGPCWLRYLK
jgi:DNA invertase Pin-like site-specific DNA recombinase